MHDCDPPRLAPRRRNVETPDDCACGFAQRLEEILEALEAMRDCARHCGVEPQAAEFLARAFMRVDAALGRSVRELHEIAEKSSGGGPAKATLRLIGGAPLGES